MKLLFNQDKLRRSMTRDEWKKVDRWRRVTEHALMRTNDRMLEDFRNLIVFGSTSEELRKNLADIIVNPVLVYKDESEF